MPTSTRIITSYYIIILKNYLGTASNLSVFKSILSTDYIFLINFRKHNVNYQKCLCFIFLGKSDGMVSRSEFGKYRTRALKHKLNNATE
jgi:hypothetical protein